MTGNRRRTFIRFDRGQDLWNIHFVLVRGGTRRPTRIAYANRIPLTQGVADDFKALGELSGHAV